MASFRAHRLVLLSGRNHFISRKGAQQFHRSAVRLCSCADAVSSPAQPKGTVLKTTPLDSDHRTLGLNLDLFSTSPYSPGSPLFHPDGSHIFLKLQSFLRAQYAAHGFQEVVTPTIYKQSLWETSGHWENYKDDMFQVTGRGAQGETTGKEIGEDEKYGLKPMNCPGHCLLFKSRKRSYRHLPIRYTDFSPLHRNEISGALSGLTRVRRFHQDDGHIFCRPDQVGGEIQRTLQFVSMVYEAFGLGPFKLLLSTRPKTGFMGGLAEWDRAEEQLKEALDLSGRRWSVSEGDGAFYGPKIDIILQDGDGKEHQTATIQLDFQLPRKFELSYVTPSKDGKDDLEKQDLSESPLVSRPVLIHRAVLGSLERFMALLIEHYKGRWPFWLSPRQAVIITIDEQQSTLDYAQKLTSSLNGFSDEHRSKLQPLNSHRFKVDANLQGESLSSKIMAARKKGYNLICVVGKNEVKNGTVSVDLSRLSSLEKVLERCQEVGVEVKKPRAVQLDMAKLKDLMKWMTRLYI